MVVPTSGGETKAVSSFFKIQIQLPWIKTKEVIQTVKLPFIGSLANVYMPEPVSGSCVAFSIPREGPGLT